ncbi:MAG: baseplate assembly protein [Aeromonadaceae bacterium]
MAGIDLDLLPAPSAIKQLTHEEIQEEMRKVANLDSVSPSDPAGRVLLAGSYRENLLRQEADEQVRAVLLATSRGSDLDHLGVTYYRDVDGNPVKRLSGETDNEYRYRLHDSPEGLSTAGPKGSYEFHSRSAHRDVKQALCTSPEDVCIEMIILSKVGDGTAQRALCDLVEVYLWPRRPMTDKVTAVSAEILRYRVKAKLWQAKNPDSEAVTKQANENLRAYVDLQHKLKGRVSMSALHAVLRVSGVEEVELEGWSDVICTEKQAPFCEGLEIEFAGWIDDRE